ncbi:hypothetical protein HRbin01_00404 [archaeon HR01]|nr:hypothetical protein HRbin01_00404 [archaeon HR01]
MDEIEEKVKKYQTRAVVIAILVHFLIFVTAIVTIVILRQPLIMFILTHATIQAAAVANVIIGPGLYRKYLITSRSRRISIS